jgi:hypothetical protein
MSEEFIALKNKYYGRWCDMINRYGEKAYIAHTGDNDLHAVPERLQYIWTGKNGLTFHAVHPGTLERHCGLDTVDDLKIAVQNINLLCDELEAIFDSIPNTGPRNKAKAKQNAEMILKILESDERSCRKY